MIQLGGVMAFTSFQPATSEVGRKSGNVVLLLCMDDTDKTQGQTPSQPPQAGGVGSLVKEHGPISTGVRSSSPEPEIHPKLEQIGVVESAPEFPTLGPSEQKAGISPAGDSVPVEPSGIVHPSIMTEEEAKQTLKQEKPTASIKWIAALVVKFFKKIHLKLLTNKG